ncbi:MAG TPA: hypothetical protein VGV13_04955 [Methylomirabilota bacterium]|nr:hypothetical protein [Methylomirabilota bacterium]
MLPPCRRGPFVDAPDLQAFLTNELIDDCNSYDKERTRRMAREWK